MQELNELQKSKGEEINVNLSLAEDSMSLIYDAVLIYVDSLIAYPFQPARP